MVDENYIPDSRCYYYIKFIILLLRAKQIVLRFALDKQRNDK